MSDGPCNVYELNQAFLDALEFMDRVILDRSKKNRRLFIDLIPRGVYPLGEGIVRKTHRFYGEVGDQSGLLTWQNIQISRPASGGDPGYDACRHESEIVDYAFETLNYTGIETSRRTKDICLKDIKYKWEFRQQLQLIFGFLADITLSIWENYGREMYLKFAADAGNIYVMTEGSPDGTTLSATYDPMTSTDITIPRDLDISVLDWSFMEWWYQWLELQVRASAIGNSDGMPVWGLAIHPKDFDYMIRNDSDVREDFRYSNSKVLIDNFGTVKEYKGFALTHDMQAPRFAIKSTDATTLTLERVEPFIYESTTVGEKPVANPAYLNAEYAFGIILLKDVFEALMPPSGPGAPGGGTSFGTTPNLNGDFAWLNIQDRCDNPYNEKGFYASRYEVFAKPLEYSDEAIVFLYKRCPQTTVKLCTPCDSQAAVGTEVFIASDSAYSLVSGSDVQAEITLSSCLGCEAPAEVTVTDDNGATTTAVLSDDSAAPTYILTWADTADRPAAADMNDVNVASVTCA